MQLRLNWKIYDHGVGRTLLNDYRLKLRIEEGKAGGLHSDKSHCEAMRWITSSHFSLYTTNKAQVMVVSCCDSGTKTCCVYSFYRRQKGGFCLSPKRSYAFNYSVILSYGP
jgi:hypothetical protein